MRPIAVFGPTASGKSALGLALAQELDGEVVNVDSMQLYRGMDIGTAKLTPAEREGIPHHQLDVWHVTETASVARYQRDAIADVESIMARGKTPILVGGSSPAALRRIVRYGDGWHTLRQSPDEVAAGLGERVALARGMAALGAVMLCGAATAACGPIAFVGLMVPHAGRLVFGVDHRWLLPCSARSPSSGALRWSSIGAARCA